MNASYDGIVLVKQSPVRQKHGKSPGLPESVRKYCRDATFFFF